MDDYPTEDSEQRLFSYDYVRGTPYLINATLHFRLPPLVPADSTCVGWTRSVGYAMIECIEVRIGDQVVARKAGSSLAVMDDLETPPMRLAS